MGRLTDDMNRLRGEMDASREGRRSFVLGLNTNVGEMLTGFGEARAEMGSQNGAERQKFVSELVDAVGEMLTGFGETRAEMGSQSGAERQKFVSELADAVGEMLSGFCEIRTEIADETNSARLAFMNKLQSTVADMRQEFVADLDGASAAWLGIPSVEQKVTASTVESRIKAEEPLSQASPVEQGAEDEEPEVKEESAGTNTADELTVIKGIGPQIQASLYLARITTYERLASCTPEEIRNILGKSSGAADVNSWIEQAKELV